MVKAFARRLRLARNILIAPPARYDGTLWKACSGMSAVLAETSERGSWRPDSYRLGMSYSTTGTNLLPLPESYSSGLWLSEYSVNDIFGRASCMPALPTLGLVRRSPGSDEKL